MDLSCAAAGPPIAATTFASRGVTTARRSEKVDADYRVRAHKSNIVPHTGLMAWDKTPWAPPLVELAGGMTGHLLAWERHERDGSWWAWVSGFMGPVGDAITR